MKQVENVQSVFYFRQVSDRIEKKEKIYAALTDMLCLFLFLEGIGGGLISMFGIQYSNLVLAVWNLVLSLVFSCFCYMEKQKQKIGIGIWLGLWLLACLILGTWLENGSSLILNQAVDTIGRQFPYAFPVYEVTIKETEYLGAVTVTLGWTAGIFAFLGSYLIQRGNRILLGAMAVFFLLCQGIFGIYPAFFWNVLLFFSWLFLWMRGHSEKVSPSRQRLALIGQAVLGMAVLLLTFGVMQLFLPIRTYQKNETLVSWKKEWEETIREWRYDGASQVLPEGDFRNLTSFKTSEKPVLEITMSTPQSYYLRGFTGSTYEGNGWKDLEKEKRYEGHDLFYWLHNEDFYGQEILGIAGTTLDGKIREEEKNVITINNRNGSSRYAYTPYELLNIEAVNLQKQKLGDEGILTTGWHGQRKYTYQAAGNLVTKYPKLASYLLNEEQLSKEGKQYQKQESHYNEFVYKNYLEIPGNMRTELKKMLGDTEITNGQKHTDYGSAKQNILYFLNSNCQYSEELSEMWNGNDFINDFLNHTKKGYSVHYASAATMMFRYYGIPSRYVEGYLVTPEDVKTMSPGKPYVLDETHAHVWVEYYQDGVGWLPFETTPSYMKVMEQAEQYQDISQLSSQSSGSQQQQDEEEEKEEKPEEKPEMDWLLILEIVLLVAICFILIILLWIIGWVFYQRHKSKKLKKLFEHPDPKSAVRSMFQYTMNILSAAGMKIQNISLYGYGPQMERMFDRETRKAYEEVVFIRQKAVYSGHEITEEEKQKVLTFKNQIWHRIYEHSGWLWKLQLKFIYFL